MYMSNICKTVTLRTRKINCGDLSVPVKRGSGVSQLVAFTDSFLTFQVYLFLPLADADASA